MGGTMPSRMARTRKDGLHRPGGAQEVAGHGLGAAHQQFGGVFPKDLLEGLAFVSVTHRGGGGVGIDVIDVGRGEAGVLQGQDDAAPGPFLVRVGDVVGVAGHAEADDLAVDLGAPGHGVVQFLQGQDAGAFGHDKAGAVEVEGPAGAPRGCR